MKYSNICLILLSLTRNTGSLEKYFSETSTNLYVYVFSPVFSEETSTLTYYRNGKKLSEKKFFIYKGKNKFLKILFQYLYYFYIALFVLPRKTYVITYQPLYCLLNNLLNLTKKIEIIFFPGDFFSERKNLITRIYHSMSNRYCRKLRYVLYPSPRLKQAYDKGNSDNNLYRDVVVYGIKKMNIKRRPQNNLLGFVGNLRPQQGLELIFEALTKNPNLRLDVIGGGSFIHDFKKLSGKMGIGDRVKFYGYVEDGKIGKIVGRWQIGLAPYVPTRDNMSYYADPSKTKFYLQYNIPVIMTKITYFSNELTKFMAGRTIDYEAVSLLDAVEKIQTNYQIYLSGADKLVDKYEYKKYYDLKFKFIK